jgi:hypothetical protein
MAMRTFLKRGFFMSAGMLTMAALAHGADYSQPSLLPLPTSNWQSPTSVSYLQPQPEMVQAPAPSDLQQPTPAMQPTYSTSTPSQGCNSCGNGGGMGASSGGCNSFYSSNTGSGNGGYSDGSGGCGGFGDDGTGYGNGFGNWYSCCGGQWFGSVGYIFMGRNQPNKFWTSYQTNNNTNQTLNTQMANDQKLASGGEVRIGRMFGDCTNGVEGIYWTTAPLTGFSSYRDAAPANSQVGNVSTPIDVGNVNAYLPGNVINPASGYFDNANEHRIVREDWITNVEVNFLRNTYLCNCGNLNIQWIAGVRWFRFQEYLEFCSAQGGSDFGADGTAGANSIHLKTKTTNDLVGFQFGSRLNYMFGNRLGFFVVPKFGIYGNQVNTRNDLQLGDGTYLQVAGTNQNWHYTGRNTTFSTLGQIDVGTTYQFACNWRAYAGYRVIGITNVGLGDNQFLPFLADAAGYQDPKTNGSLVLHGGFVGLEHRF